MTREMPHQWESWLPLVEYWYNTSYHNTIKMSPFKALYGYSHPVLVPYHKGDSKIEAVDVMLREREVMNRVLKQQIEMAQNKMKLMTDKKRSDWEFNIGDQVLVKLQPYRQSSMHKGNVKLQPKYYGPFEVVDRIGKVAYKLKLPEEAQIHDVFCD